MWTGGVACASYISYDITLFYPNTLGYTLAKSGKVIIACGVNAIVSDFNVVTGRFVVTLVYYNPVADSHNRCSGRCGIVNPTMWTVNSQNRVKAPTAEAARYSGKGT